MENSREYIEEFPTRDSNPNDIDADAISASEWEFVDGSSYIDSDQQHEQINTLEGCNPTLAVDHKTEPIDGSTECPIKIFVQNTEYAENESCSDSEDDGNSTDGDPSDGISVISESDCCSRVSPAPFHRVETDDDIVERYRNVLTVPAITSVAETLISTVRTSDQPIPETDSGKTTKITNTNPKNVFEFSAGKLVYFSVLAGITGIVLAHYFNLKRDDCSILSHISPLVQRINDLEQENIAMKSKINGFMGYSDENISGRVKNLDLGFYPQPLEFYIKNTIKKRGRLVWRGDDLDPRDPVVLPNRKLEIPEFCNHPDNGDDLFAEEYIEICERQREKISRIISKTNYKENERTKTANVVINDDKLESEMISDEKGMNFEFVQNEEQVKLSKKELRKQKNKLSNKIDSNEKEESKSKKKNKSNRKIKRQQNVSEENFMEQPSEWMENRRRGRDEMREKNKENLKKMAENWYLTRANWREAQRNKNDQKNPDNLKKFRAF